MFGKKKASPTVKAVKAQASRETDGPVTPADTQQAAHRNALLKELPTDLRRQERKDRVQMRAEDRRNGPA
ncbi:hypothetical protein [Streptomyces yaizuensis]|uniref:DUF3043 domain-containing protein n=1 Tax=Streptomyces yaizuensis TaxID=2989713 RepID=A0ABQ5P430_9ACTN|nr:hypothetical protein [Streptomyces sp. YSPA8]GLF97315.1 hypothetical protein SYYSPA8_23480 [Streptomyces sp. YSPA8]